MGILNIVLSNKVPFSVQSQRYSKCLVCPYFKTKLKTCGIPLLGGYVNENGVIKKLCGCFIPEKIKFELEQCPLDKW